MHQWPIQTGFTVFISLFFLQITCRNMDFISKDNSKEVDEVRGQLLLPPNIAESLPLFNPEYVKEASKDKNGYIQDWNDELGYIQDWNDELGFIQDWNDELGFIQDWNDELEYIQGWEVSNLPTLENKNLFHFYLSGEDKIVTGALPTGPRGIFKYSVKKDSDENYLQVQALGYPDNILIYSLIENSNKALLDLYGDYSYRLIAEINAHPLSALKLNKSSGSVEKNKSLNKEIYDMIKFIPLDQGTNTIETKRNMLRDKVIQEKMVELKDAIAGVSALPEDVVEKIITGKKEENSSIQPTPAVTATPTPQIVTEIENIFKFPSDVNKWVVLKNGPFSFTMGLNPGSEPYELLSEMGPDIVLSTTPAHKVVLSSFKILKYEVSAGLYKECVNLGGCSYNTVISPKNLPTFGKLPNHPMVYITSEEAREFCQWIGGDLPTEAQWEFSARGYSDYIFPWGNDISPSGNPESSFANFVNSSLAKDSFDASSPIDEKTFELDRSKVGVYGLAGNVDEWCLDYYDMEFYSKPEATLKDPVNDKHGTFRLVRGGGFAQTYREGHNYRRQIETTRLPIQMNGATGFRCAAKVP